jgi:hypothetical protein
MGGVDCNMGSGTSTRREAGDMRLIASAMLYGSFLIGPLLSAWATVDPVEDLTFRLRHQVR